MRTLAFLPLCAALLTQGCRHHLGDDHGVAYVNAFVAQGQVKDTQPPSSLDATDAERVLSQHRGASIPKAGGAAAGAVPLLLPVPR